MPLTNVKYFQGLTSHTAVTISHEIAHTIGVDHDDVNDRRCNKTYFVMSPRLGEDTPSTSAKWSICSKERMASLLQSSKTNCLLHQNSTEKFKVSNYGVKTNYAPSKKQLPGVIFEPDRQCQMLFDRPDSHVCNNQKDSDGFCLKLW